MGWWWGPQPTSSPTNRSGAQSTEDESSQLQSRSTASANGVNNSEAGSTSEIASSKARTRDEQALEDLRDLFAGIDPVRAAKASAVAKEQAARPALPTDEDSLYASTMSCRQCFDQAYYCSSLGGQLNNIYRYGGMRSCSDAWSQWRFCMRTKAMSEEMKREKIREWEQKKVVKYKTGRSSEDVWNVRTEPVENPFSVPLP